MTEIAMNKETINKMLQIRYILMSNKLSKKDKKERKEKISLIIV